MRARVLFSRRAAARTFAEVRRFVERGLASEGVPHEALVYPLSVIFPAGEPLSPVERAGADAIDRLVVDDAAIPPDEVKVFSAANCHFDGDRVAEVNAAFNREIAARVRAQPRLAVLSKLHSHPFSRAARPSGGDILAGVVAPAARAWRARRGLDTTILHIVYPDREPHATPAPWRITPEGALAESPGGAVRWRVRTWASAGDEGQMRDLGDARVAGDDDPYVRAARRPPYYARPAGAAWCDGQKRALREAGYRVSRNLLGRGWRRYLVEAQGRTLLIALPPDFPRVPPRVLHVRRAWRGDFVPLALPPWAEPGRPLRRWSLCRLVAHYGPPPGEEEP